MSVRHHALWQGTRDVLSAAARTLHNGGPARVPPRGHPCPQESLRARRPQGDHSSATHGVAMVRVLVVDDHVSYRRLMVRLLRTSGFEVIGDVGNGRDAVEMVLAKTPDVVLLDILLPDFDGFEVARRLVVSPVPPLIVFISSRQRDEFGTLADGGTIRGFLSKDEFTVERLNGLLAGE
jgi:CheY-like chemotaxis protein